MKFVRWTFYGTLALVTIVATVKAINAIEDAQRRKSWA